MLSPNEVQPQFYGWRETLKRREQLSADELAGHTQFFRAYLQTLEQRLNWELPLLAGFQGFAEVSQQLVDSLRVLADQPEEPHRVEAAERALAGFHQLQQLRPLFTDISVVNELLTLAAQETCHDQSVRERLPLLLAWIGERENDWKAFGLLNPGRASLVEKSLYALQAIKGGAGAVHLYLEGEEPQGLRQGLQLIADTLKALAPAEETRFLVESAQADVSLDLRLDRCSKLVRKLGQLPAEYRGLVARSLADRRTEWNDLRSQAFMTGVVNEVAEPAGRELETLEEELGEALSSDRPGPLLAFLERIEQLRLDLEKARPIPPENNDFRHAEEVQIS